VVAKRKVLSPAGCSLWCVFLRGPRAKKRGALELSLGFSMASASFEPQSSRKTIAISPWLGEELIPLGL
jgi:hypothetical protein